jgi:energy-coupling factor transporter ATP-binding protein EcfA2
MDKFFTPTVMDAAFAQADLSLIRYHERRAQIEAERAAREHAKIDAENAERLKRLQAEQAAENEAQYRENRSNQIRSESDFVANPELLRTIVSRYDNVPGDLQEAIRERFERRIEAHLDDNSKIDFHSLPFEGRLMFLPVYLGLLVGKDYPRFDFDRANARTNEYFFTSHYGPADAAPWRERKAMIDRYLGDSWQVQEIDGTTVKLWRLPQLPERLSFDPAALKKEHVLFGVRCDSGKPHYTPLADMSHLLICGQTGKGKSTLSKGLVMSLLHNLDLIDSITLIDLKAGLELAPYAALHPKIRFIDSYEELPPLIDSTVDIMQARFKELRAAGHVKATSGFHVIIFDEFAVIENFKSSDKAVMATHAQLKAKLNLLGQQARAAGIKLIVMSQRPTTDSIESTLKANLASLISFMMSSAQNARDMFSGETLPVDVTTLPRGEFVYRDDAAGATLHLKALFTGEVDMAALATLIPKGETP